MQCERAGANVSDATWRVNLFEPLLRLVFRSHLLLRYGQRTGVSFSYSRQCVQYGACQRAYRQARPSVATRPDGRTAVRCLNAVPRTDLCRLLSAPVLPALVSAIVDCTSSEEPLRRLYAKLSPHYAAQLLSRRRRVMLLQHTQLAKQLNWWAGARTHTPLAPLGESCCVGVHMDRHGVSFSCVSPSPESDGARLCYVMSPVAWTEPNLAKVVAVLAVVAVRSALSLNCILRAS